MQEDRSKATGPSKKTTTCSALPTLVAKILVPPWKLIFCRSKSIYLFRQQLVISDRIHPGENLWTPCESVDLKTPTLGMDGTFANRVPSRVSEENFKPRLPDQSRHAKPLNQMKPKHPLNIQPSCPFHVSLMSGEYIAPHHASRGIS